MDEPDADPPDSDDWDASVESPTLPPVEARGDARPPADGRETGPRSAARRDDAQRAKRQPGHRERGSRSLVEIMLNNAEMPADVESIRQFAVTKRPAYTDPELLGLVDASRLAYTALMSEIRDASPSDFDSI